MYLIKRINEGKKYSEKKSGLWSGLNKKTRFKSQTTEIKICGEISFELLICGYIERNYSLRKHLMLYDSFRGDSLSTHFSIPRGGVHDK